MSKPTIDLELEQVRAEIFELLQRFPLTMRERQRYEALLHRMHQLGRVVTQRNEEHEKGER